MLGGNGAVWPATQAIANDAVRPSPAGQMSKLFTDESLTVLRLRFSFAGARRERVTQPFSRGPSTVLRRALRRA